METERIATEKKTGNAKKKKEKKNILLNEPNEVFFPYFK